jgi:hypothetical protein
VKLNEVSYNFRDQVEAALVQAFYEDPIFPVTSNEVGKLTPEEYEEVQQVIGDVLHYASKYNIKNAVEAVSKYIDSLRGGHKPQTLSMSTIH